MRVALLSYNARSSDAIGQSVADKLALFLDHHAEVRVYLEDDRQLHPSVKPYAQLVAGSKQMSAIYKELQTADLVLAEYGHYYPLLSLLPGLAGGKPRVVINYHGVTPPELWPSGQREVLERGVRCRALLWSADAVLVHSQFTLRELRDQLGYPEDRLHQLGFPLDLQHFSPGTAARNWRRELNLEDARLLLYVGRMAPNKNVPLLIEALARLREHQPKVHLLLAGNDGDLYQAEAEACRRLACERGVADRVHFLGQQHGSALRDLYRCADVLVHPSRWETFCLPIVEAMACGLPVVAARATALPETVGDAGLAFASDDVADLVRQLERVLTPGRPPARKGKVAVVAFRFGIDFVGGAETSLRTMARALQANGVAVEVFTTCVRSESNWRNELREGNCIIDGLSVRRFPIDAHDRPRHLETVRRILDAKGAVSVAAAREYLDHSIQSTALVEDLKRRADEFDAIIVGPYLFGLSAAVAQALGEKTLVVPCFHDEPFAQLQIWPEVYGNIGGLLWHSAEEKHFAEVDLGFNHPRSCTVATLLCEDKSRDRKGAETPDRSLTVAALPERYLVYCGRYTSEKELPRLLGYMRHCEERHPGRFTLVCVGQGPIELPSASWLIDLGFVSEDRKHEVLAGAAALVQLSRFESLSLVALEAWSLGVPVIADPACAVLAGHLQRCDGGQAVADFESFARALDTLWDDPEAWKQRGQRGQGYVRKEYGSPAKYWAQLQTALDELTKPLSDCMRERGLQRARLFDRPAWRERFSALMESVLEAKPLARRLDIEIKSLSDSVRVAKVGGSELLPVKVSNRGTQLVWPEGLARWTLRAEIAGCQDQVLDTPLPGPLAPGQTLAAMVRLPIPAVAGEYQARVWAEREGMASPAAVIRLTVGSQEGAPCDMLLGGVRAAVAEAHRLQQLPDDYHDVTQGLLAGVKKRIKSKLLGNFKHAYVDVLSRQQSACNEQLVRAVGELAECCSTLDHAVRLLNDEVRRLKTKLHKRKRQARRRSPAPESETP